MTRINVGIPPKELNVKHLMAEHREIVRIPNAISKGKFNLKGQPKEFTLGTGHIKYFYTRLGYLKDRYEELYQECLNRGYKPTYFGNSWDNIPKHLMGQYTPSERDIQLIRERIKERLKK